MLGLGWAFGEKKVKNRVFHAEERIYNLHISLSKLVSLSGSPLLALSTIFHTYAIPLELGFALSVFLALRERSKIVTLRIPTVRLRGHML